MAKGKKNDKKGKKDKGKNKSKSKTTAVESENDEPDPNIQSSQGEFTLPNEDVYIGEFCAHRQGLIWREGHGIYKTKDGQEYEGQWHNDKLVEDSPVEIRYPQGHTFVGLLSKDKYNGPGTYYFSDVMISCNFENNKPQGEIALIDPNGEVYVGKAHENRTTLLPANVLFDNISPSRGMILYDPTPIVDTTTDMDSAITCLLSETKDDGLLKAKQINWEEIIFAKSKKTDTRMYFEESDWYKDWYRFKNTKERIKSGIPPIDEHCSIASCHDDVQWSKDYELYKGLRRQKTSSVKDIVHKEDLLSLFHSPAYNKSCPVVRVVYPSSTWDTFNSVTDYGDQKESFNPDGDENESRKVGGLSLVAIQQPLETAGVNSVNNVIKTTSDSKGKHKCLNQKNYRGGTTSLITLVNNFLDNKPVQKQYASSSK